MSRSIRVTICAAAAALSIGSLALARQVPTPTPTPTPMPRAMPTPTPTPTPTPHIAMHGHWHGGSDHATLPPATVAALIEALHDTDADVRQVLMLLMRLDVDVPMQTVLDPARARDSDTRGAALQLLSRSKDPQALAAIEAAPQGRRRGRPGRRLRRARRAWRSGRSAATDGRAEGLERRRPPCRGHRLGRASSAGEDWTSRPTFC